MRRFNIIIALSATLGLSSCDLDMTPMDQVSDAVFWQKPSDFESVSYTQLRAHET